MKAAIPKSPRPLRKPRPGLAPACLHGSFNFGLLQVSPKDIIADLLIRVADAQSAPEKLVQAQRTIGALMAFTAANLDGCGTGFYHKDVFAQLAALTGETPDQLVYMAGGTR